MSSYGLFRRKKLRPLLGISSNCCCKFVRLSVGKLVIVVQLPELKSEFCRTVKLAEGTVHERSRFSPVVVRFNCGDGVEYEV